MSRAEEKRSPSIHSVTSQGSAASTLCTVLETRVFDSDASVIDLPGVTVVEGALKLVGPVVRTGVLLTLFDSTLESSSTSEPPLFRAVISGTMTISVSAAREIPYLTLGLDRRVAA